MREVTAPDVSGKGESRERAAVVKTQSWAGYNEIPVTVLGETPKRYRCRWEETSLGRSKGSIRLVPKAAVKFSGEEAGRP